MINNLTNNDYDKPNTNNKINNILYNIYFTKDIKNNVI